jgi:hypothetical protein
MESMMKQLMEKMASQREVFRKFDWKGDKFEGREDIERMIQQQLIDVKKR